MKLLRLNAKYLRIFAICLLAAFLTPYLFPNDKAAILNVFEQAAALAEVSATNHPLERIGEVNKLLAYFTDELELQFKLKDIDEIRIIGKKDLKAKALASKSAMKSLELNFEPLDTDINGDTAEVILRASALGSTPDVKGKFFEQHQLKVFLVQQSGDWLISRVTHLKNERDVDSN